MKPLPEPDDVDFIVSGGDSDPKSIQETIEFIRDYKSRPGYANEVEAANQLLATLGIDPEKYGMDDPKALLDHWKRCVDQLAKDSPNGPNSRSN
jgi:hypothetical protein